MSSIVTVPSRSANSGHGRGGIALAGDEQVAGVERELQARDALRQREIVVDRLDQHAGLGLQRRRDAAPARVADDLFEPGSQPSPRASA